MKKGCSIFTVIIAYLTPKLLLTKMVGWLAKKELGLLTQWLIKLFCFVYHIDINESELTDITDYKTFNQFFIRKLKEDVRPIDTETDSIVYPADGKVSQVGQLQQDIMLQAKGHYFSLLDLLAGKEELAELFINGNYLITYLSPSDYHRVHMPCDAILQQMIYVPGELFSVNPVLAKNIPNLFARNERVICVFETAFGVMVQILVGATITASISTVWHGVINPPRIQVIREFNYTEQEPEITLAKGDEMGAFQMGSTVINLFPTNSIQFIDGLMEGDTVRVGEKMASINQLSSDLDEVVDTDN